MTTTSMLTRQEAEELVYRECQLLDEGKLEEWLTLFSDDGVYWLPASDSADPEREPSLIYDDALQRTKRVHQLVHESHLAQRPASRTVHLVSNLRAEPQVREDEALVRCNLMVAEIRPGDHQATQYSLGAQRVLAAQCEYRFRREGGRWAIAMKKVLLIDRDLPQYNLSFIL